MVSRLWRLNFLFSRHSIIREKSLEKKERLSRKPSRIWKAKPRNTGKEIPSMTSGTLLPIDLVILNGIACLFLEFQVIQSSRIIPNKWYQSHSYWIIENKIMLLVYDFVLRFYSFEYLCSSSPTLKRLSIFLCKHLLHICL